MSSEWKLQLYIHVSAPDVACQFRTHDLLLGIVGETLYSY